MGYKKNYKNISKTHRIDLSSLGCDMDGKPFYVIVYNTAAMKYGDRQAIMRQRFKDVNMKKVDVKNNANEMFATAIIKEWNLLDWETDKPADSQAFDALEHVPPEVADAIIAYIMPNEDEKKAEKKLIDTVKSILLGRRSSWNLPDDIDFTEWNEYSLCKKFHCLPSQLREENAKDIDLMMSFAHMEDEVEQTLQKEREREYKS